VGEVCGRLLRPVNLELGGKSRTPSSWTDAELDLQSVGAQLTPALFGNNGQTCFLSSRVLAPRSRTTEVRRHHHRAGPVAHRRQTHSTCQPRWVRWSVGQQRDRVEGYIAKGREEGARLVAGRRPTGGNSRGGGSSIRPSSPTSNNSSTIAQEEIFGPVVTITPYTDDEDAVRLANDSEYGLGGTVWTTDPERGLNVARHIESGNRRPQWLPPRSAFPHVSNQSQWTRRQTRPRRTQGLSRIPVRLSMTPAGRTTLPTDLDRNCCATFRLHRGRRRYGRLCPRRADIHRTQAPECSCLEAGVARPIPAMGNPAAWFGLRDVGRLGLHNGPTARHR